MRSALGVVAVLLALVVTASVGTLAWTEHQRLAMEQRQHQFGVYAANLTAAIADPVLPNPPKGLTTADASLVTQTRKSYQQAIAGTDPTLSTAEKFNLYWPTWQAARDAIVATALAARGCPDVTSP